MVLMRNGCQDGISSNLKGSIAMNIRSLVIAAHTGIVVLLGATMAAQAAEVKVLTSYSMRSVMNEVGPLFERASGHRLAMKFDTPAKITQRLQDGETADVAIMVAPAFSKVQVVPGSLTPVARGLIGVAVPQGAPRPDISSPEAIKRALLAAKSIAITREGAPGIHLVKLFDSWGIADELKPKTVTGDHVGGLDAQLFVHAMSSMALWKKVDIVGPLPDALQPDTAQAAAIMAGATDVKAGKALIDFLRTPEAAAVIRSKGMGPL